MQVSATGVADINGGNLVVLDLIMIGGTINTGEGGELGVANSLSLTANDGEAAVINGALDVGAIGGGIEITGANTSASPDAYIHANIIGISNITFLGGDIAFDGDNSLYTGDFIINNGNISINGDNSLTDISLAGGTLSGTGVVGNVTAYSGQINPGNSPGILTINGNLVLSSSDTLNFEINGTTPGSGYDQILVTGDVVLNDAILDVEMLGFFMPGNSFTIITGANSISGTFAGLSDGEIFLVDGLPIRINYNETTVTLTLDAITLFNSTFTANPSNPTAGQNITITSIWSSNGVTPQGTATLFNGSTNLGTVNLVNGVATFNITLPAGTHTLHVEYSGDELFGGAISSDLELNVGVAMLANTGVKIPVIPMLGLIVLLTSLLVLLNKKAKSF